MSGLHLAAAQQANKLAAKHFPEGLTPDLIKLFDDFRSQLMSAYIAGEASGDTVASQKWSNQASFGYAIMAGEKIGMDEPELNRLVRAMHGIHDMRSVEEAAEHYRMSPY